MIIRLNGVDSDGNYRERVIPHHKCTEEDFEEFYPFDGDETKTANSAADFNCIDWDDEDPYLVYGDQATGVT